MVPEHNGARSCAAVSDASKVRRLPFSQLERISQYAWTVRIVFYHYVGKLIEAQQNLSTFIGLLCRYCVQVEFPLTPGTSFLFCIVIAMAENSSFCLSGAAPIDLANTFICNAGFYCTSNWCKLSELIAKNFPLGSESKGINPPQYCAPTKECQAVRLQTVENTCDQPQGLYEPIVCTKGYYCPRPGDQRYLCPAKYYCPLGTESPVKCGPLSVCPSGSSREFHLDGFVVALVLDIILLIIIFVPLHLRVCNLGFKKYHRDSRSGSEEILEAAEGPTLLSIAGDRETDYPNISITYQDITFELGELTRPLVSSVSGSIERGMLCGILGPSGAGKSKRPTRHRDFADEEQQRS